ncbi:MAG: lamin tail domain-containing protein, partial [Solirubrobacteraceae bacterium]
LAASPLILGSDLRQLNAAQNPVDLALLRNRRVVGIDQDGISAQRVSVTANSQVFSKTEPNGDVIVGLFNTDYSQPEVVSTTAAKVGLAADGLYEMRDLWGDNSDLCAAQSVLTASPTPKSVKAPLCSTGSSARYETAGAISANVPAEGVAFYELTPLHQGAPSSSAGGDLPSTTLDLSGVARLTAGQPTTATLTFTNNGATPVSPVNLGLSTPAGWTVTPQSCPGAGDIAPGQAVTATFVVTSPNAQTHATVTATAGPSSSPQPQCQSVAPASGAPASGTTSVSANATVVTSPVVINEIQTGSTTTPNQQFVELYNPGASAVDVSDWQLQYQDALVPRRGGAPTVLATIPKGTSLAAGGYYLIGGAGYVSSSAQPPSGVAFVSKSRDALSGIGGGVGLVDAGGSVVDSVGWGVEDNEGFAPSAFRRTSDVFVQNCAAQANGVVPTVTTPTLSSRISAHPTPPSIPNGDSLVRLPNGQDTGSNCDDFSVTKSPSPGATNLP